MGRRLWIEMRFGSNCAPREPQDLAHRVDQFLAQRSEHQSSPDSHQEFVVEQAPEAGQRAAHRRLAEIHAVAGVRHISLGEQRIQCDQQIEIKLMQVHAG